MDKRYVVGLGEALWDVLPEGKKLGGAPANFAYHAGQFVGSDNSIAISALGEDKLAEETIEALEEHGLKYLMPRVPYPTGTVQVTLNEEGIPTYDIKENVAWDNIPFTPEIEEIAANCRAVCYGSLAQRNVVSRENIHRFLDATPNDCMKIFDINLRQQFYNKEIIQQSMRRCNILKINDEELVIIGRMFGYPGLDIENKCWLILGKYNLDMLVLTCGTNGSYVFTRGQMSFVHRLLLCRHPQRQARHRGPRVGRQGQRLRLHPERRHAHLAPRPPRCCPVVNNNSQKPRTF